MTRAALCCRSPLDPCTYVASASSTSYAPRMRRFHIAIGVQDIARSVEDYSARLSCEPSVVVQNEYALWRTPTLNLSIRRTDGAPGALRHLGWEDPTASSFTTDTDVNGVVWEHFNAEQQDREIAETWPESAHQLSKRP